MVDYDQAEPDSLMSVTVFPADVEQETLVNRINQTGEATMLNAIFAVLRIRNQPIRFLVDSGATCNVIRAEDLSALGEVTISPTNRSLRMYNSSVCKPIGTCELTVQNPRTGVSCELKFMVMDKAPVALLGCAANQRLELFTVISENIQVNQVEADVVIGKDHSLQKAERLMMKYYNVLDGGLGRMLGVE